MMEKWCREKKAKKERKEKERKKRTISSNISSRPDGPGVALPLYPDVASVCVCAGVEHVG